MNVVELPTRDPAPGEVRVAVRAIGVNPVDWKMREQGPLRLAARVIGAPPPVVVGVDFAGVVDALGSRANGFRPGDRVVGGTDFSRRQRGSYADTVFVRPDQLCPLPEDLDFEVAGALPVAGVTAWMSVVELGRLGAGQRALILGASGGVGQLAVQIAKHVRGGYVVAVCSGKNAALVEALGADAVLDYEKGDALAQARPHGPYRVVVDCVGSYSGAGCRALLARGGRHVLVSGESLGAVAQLLVPPFSSKAVLGRPNRARLEPVVAAVAAGRVRVHVAHRFPLAEAEQAHRLSRTGRVAGKIVLVP
ncbi:MAG TPA: NAD(P)-dependent alcohol dehydrogenase [Myxococcota bacterium]|nr:NAD(P)-dependent alcohol dehydrogenase [Myxococcota bacterium]